MSRRAIVFRVACSLLAAVGWLQASGCKSRKEKQRFEAVIQKVAFAIGDTRIHAQVSTFGTRPLTLIHLHEDEPTAVQATVSVLQKRGGRLIDLVHSGHRRVTFSLEGVNYSFDPNRIFSNDGLMKTLRGDVPIPAGAYEAVRKFAEEFVSFFKLDAQPILIAVHNNGEGDLSIYSYQPGHTYAADAEQLAISSEADPDDFFYVTHGPFFEKLRAARCHVVLQNNQILRDDGSLSVFAGRRGIPYINVEAENAHLTTQIQMLEFAIAIAENYGLAAKAE
jgi:hypothetical protein